MSDNGIHPEANKLLDRLLDVFGGADGGGDFVQLRNFLNDMAKRADGGDESAEKLMLVALRFGRLVDVATGKSKKPPRRPSP
jgi:hypothetical protein